MEGTNSTEVHIVCPCYFARITKIIKEVWSTENYKPDQNWKICIQNARNFANYYFYLKAVGEKAKQN